MAGGLTALGISLFAFSPSSCYTACEFCRPAGKYELGNNRESMRVAYKYEGETVGNFKTSLTGIILAGLLLSACTSSGSGPGKVEDTLGVDPNQQAGQQQSGQQIAGMPEDEIQDPRMYCPNITLRAGTETHDVYPDGVKKEDEGAASKLRYRATITETVRDCASANGFTNIEVGVAGRFLSGPTGASGDFTMPIRVAVVRGDEVLYSQLHQVPAAIPPGRTNGTFSFVDKAISIPAPRQRNIVIYVGFDEGPYGTP